MTAYPAEPRDEVTELRYALAMIALELQRHDRDSALRIALETLQYGSSPLRLAALNPLVAVAAMTQNEEVRDAVINGPKRSR